MNTHFERGTGRLTVSPAEAAQILGVGRTFLYSLLSANEIALVKVGTRRLIRVAVLEEWLKAKEACDE